MLSNRDRPASHKVGQPACASCPARLAAAGGSQVHCWRDLRQWPGDTATGGQAGSAPNSTQRYLPLQRRTGRLSPCDVKRFQVVAGAMHAVIRETRSAQAGTGGSTESGASQWMARRHGVTVATLQTSVTGYSS